MYCIKCGAELARGQGICPICNTRVIHPDFPVDTDEAAYPIKKFKSEEISRVSLMFVVTILTLLPMLLPMIFEITWKHSISWSGYVLFGVMLFYEMFLLPLWFKRPNPVIFVPCAFFAMAAFVFYVSYKTSGSWYLTFALPVILSLGIIITAMTALNRYLKHGKLYIYGGGLVSLGLWTVLIEWLLKLAFGVSTSVKWSLFSFGALAVIGILLILIAIIKPFKEALRKIFYI